MQKWALPGQNCELLSKTDIPLSYHHVSQKQLLDRSTTHNLSAKFWPSCCSISLFSRASVCHLKTQLWTELLEISPHQGNGSACQPEKPMLTHAPSPTPPKAQTHTRNSLPFIRWGKSTFLWFCSPWKPCGRRDGNGWLSSASEDDVEIISQ